MAKKYYLKLTEIIDKIYSKSSKKPLIEVKHFFSGAAVYVNNHICLTLTPKGFALKLPENFRAKIMAKGGKKLKYFPKAPIKKEYVVLPKSMESDFSVLKKYIKLTVDKNQ